MQNLTLAEVEMLANLLARAGVNQIEASWANSVLDGLRAIALEQKKNIQKEED
jgi:isopropylmalate/homocitrate/citramalate synthase